MHFVNRYELFSINLKLFNVQYFFVRISIIYKLFMYYHD